MKGWSEPEAVALATAGGILLLSFVYDPGHMIPLSVCPFSTVTRVPCAFCGGTRSFCALARGHVAESFRHHPAGPVLYAATVIVFALAIGDFLGKRRLLRKLATAARLDSPWTYLLILAVLWGVKLGALAASGRSP